MEELIKLAEHLGQQIAANERTALLRQAQLAINQDKQAQNLIEQYQKQAAKIHESESNMKPVEVEDKHRLQAIEQQISVNDAIRELTRRQADFVEMMHKIKQTIDAQLKIDLPH